MRQLLRSAHRLMATFGVDPLKALASLRGLPPYFRDLRALMRQSAGAGEVFPLGRAYPCLDDRFTESGSARGHYFHQDLLVARRIHAASPEVHVDVGSRIDGFVAHVASFRPIRVFDIRPLPDTIPNVVFDRADLMGTLPDHLVACCDSLSCLHALEHFGLGRYGDPVRHDGHVRGLENLHRLLKPGGRLYVSVPIGPQRIEFNAHRVFSVRHLLDLFEGKFLVEEFSFVDDRGDLHEGVALAADEVAADFGCTYGCGIFELTKA